jgi:hypothetical protein
MQVIGLLSLLVELRVGTIAVLVKDVPTTASSRSHIVDEVLSLMNSARKIARAVLDDQPTVDQTTVRTPALFIATVTHHCTR